MLAAYDKKSTIKNLYYNINTYTKRVSHKSVPVFGGPDPLLSIVWPRSRSNTLVPNDISIGPYGAICSRRPLWIINPAPVLNDDKMESLKLHYSVFKQTPPADLLSSVLVKEIQRLMEGRSVDTVIAMGTVHPRCTAERWVRLNALLNDRPLHRLHHSSQGCTEHARVVWLTGGVARSR